MGGGSDYVRVFYRILEEACGDESGGMGHINPKEGTYPVCQGAHTLVVPLA